ncbi:primosomal protein N' [Bordetella parapertussis]|uniref:Replication restart protein PriA n=2 Tax=Bordetella parapertussis TaxID=519 RepID=Q7W3B4_BORPA|nr:MULTISPECIES: primosomal protein N' [Bordetella]AOB41016.1 primosomal protein N' [Bordetella parapertussis]AUL45055.1 primosomal protein N' [Bordetella parapertussis]AWP64957.1 primosomal protein N' [Bordetella parapertussis]AWP72465.1 primosomal protein N' [Bordetella parapertussis]AWP81938.1 primosomal protein N' [Bordetella bronchiseptica]
MSDASSADPALPAADAAGVWVRVALDVPLPGPFDYRSAAPLPLGARVIVPFGRRKLVGVVVEHPAQPSIDPAQVREVEQPLEDLPPMPADWMRLARFAADYYQRPLGEVMLPVLPPPLRKPSAYQGKRSGLGPVARLDARKPRAEAAVAAEPDQAPELNEAQREAVDTIGALSAFQPVLLHGVTGSGKTEVYLHAAARVLQAGRQVLLMVPEINLTPQLEGALRARLEALVGPQGVAILHSGLADGERVQAWARAQRGQARLLLGTRMAIFAPLPELGLIVVDEEHDPSYKQQEGLRYSARDLAIWRARDLDIPVVLGSATPSLESWQHAERGRYLRLTLPGRARASSLPEIRLIDTRRLQLKQGLAPQFIEAIGQRLERGEQSLVFLNRRGYAPVLHCASCAWVSHCPRCSTFTVLHRGPGAGGYRLQCHHCGYQAPVPRACPECGDQDLEPMGRGTQRIEEQLAEWFPQARIARIDADSTRRKGSAQALFAAVHAGEVDIMVGTQMVAKGHDFARLGLVGVLNADSMLFAHDFRAPERLFAQLMQVAGRAGRHAAGAQVLIQTGYPEQPVYQALLRHDYAGFARHALQEREDTGLPPFAYQALLTAEARELTVAQGFLQRARDLATGEPWPGVDAITLYDPVPLRVVRVAHVERAQLLIESTSRPALQGFLTAWAACLPQLAAEARVRWQLEVDPLEI